MDFVEIPDFGGTRDVSRFGRVNASEVANALPMFRVLAGGDIDAVFPKDRGGIDFARTPGSL